MAKQAVRSLWVDTVGVSAIPIDWREALGENMEGWQSWEAIDCQTCGKRVVVDSRGQFQHSDIDDGRCDGSLYAEGPMMNYHYPLPDLRGAGVEDDPAEAARRIADLPLCIVELNGAFSLALTGGGMDLSWEICEAFMRLGYLPPYAFGDLPVYAGKPLTTRNRWVIAGCRRTAQVLQQQGKRRVQELKRTREALARYQLQEAA